MAELGDLIAQTGRLPADTKLESKHQENYRLMRMHRDQAEELMAHLGPFDSDLYIAQSYAKAQVHATLALFYQREVNP